MPCHKDRSPRKTGLRRRQFLATAMAAFPFIFSSTRTEARMTDNATTEFYVSPGGSDTAPGTQARPFATLERAQRAAREAAGDVIVHLRGGDYRLTTPLVFDETDAKRDGKNVVYQAFGFGSPAAEKVVVSGGRLIEDWTIRDGVWVAEVGTLDARQLYVDEKRVERAGIDRLAAPLKPTATGYTFDGPIAWQAPSSVEFVYRGIYPWTEPRFGVATIASDGKATTITMKQPAFAWARELYQSKGLSPVFGEDRLGVNGPNQPGRIENDPSFLTEPGTFVLDRSKPGSHVLHYLPRPGEDPVHSQVVAPVLEVLMNVQAAGGLLFRGLTFADATWLHPNSDCGFLHYHGSGYYDGSAIQRVASEDDAWAVMIPAVSQFIPGAVRLGNANDVEFAGCRFTRLGASALTAKGGADLAVTRCEFDTLAASAISLGQSERSRIEDNLVHHIGLDYSGAPGIELQGTVDCTVAHNEIRDVPHCGIASGPGRGTRILNNLVEGSMSVLADGGGIYVGGPQGSSYANGALIRGNVIRDTRTEYNVGLYTDYGAAWITVEGNVVDKANFSAILKVSPPMANVTYRGNFWSTGLMFGDDAIPASVIYEDNAIITDREELAQATKAIAASAGRRSPA